MSESRTAEISMDFGFRTGGLLHHMGDMSAPLNRWRRRLNEVWPRGLEQVKRCAPDVMRVVQDPKVLYTAALALRAEGPKATGLNGVALEELSQDVLHGLCNVLGKALASDTYRPPSDERVVKVPKASGVGTRPIVVMNAHERVVHKSAALVLRPMLDPVFDPLSFASRADRGREHAFAVARQLARAGETVWLVHDLKDAFGRLPVKRLLDVVFLTVPCPRLRTFLYRALPPASRSLGGIKQGSSLSPLMLETYLTHVLHKPWRKAGHPGRPIRYVDDQVLPTTSRALAESADAALRALLTPAGMLLKASFDEAVCDIRNEPAEWLGFQFRMIDARFRITLATDAYTKLGQRFTLAHSKCSAPSRGADVLRHWFGQLGPCFVWENRDAVIDRAIEVATVHGFTELPCVAELERRWQASHNRWRAVIRHVRNTPGYLVSGPVVPPTPTSVIR